jgi:hypothetical protein
MDSDAKGRPRADMRDSEKGILGCGCLAVEQRALWKGRTDRLEQFVTSDRKKEKSE